MIISRQIKTGLEKITSSIIVISWTVCSHHRTAKDFYQTIVGGKYEDATHRDNCQFYYYHLRDKEEWFQDQTDLEINVWLYLDGNHKT